MSFLDFVIEKRQIKSDPAKAQAVAEWPTSTSNKQQQRFLAWALLTQLTSTKCHFIWTSESEASFKKLNQLSATFAHVVSP